MNRKYETYTAMVVPFNEDESINYELYDRLCEMQINAKNNIVIPGTTGESPTLSHQEHKNLIERTVQLNQNRVKVVAGVGSNSTKEAIEFAEFAKRAGADLAMSVGPYYNKPSAEGHFEHHKIISEILPTMVYEIPARSGSAIGKEKLLELLELEGVVSLKAAFGVTEDLTEILLNKPNNVAVYSGDDTLTHYMLAMGANGVVSVSSNLLPVQINEYISSYDGTDESLNKFRNIYGALKANMAFGNPVTIKEAMYLFRDELKISDFKPVVRRPLLRVNSNNSIKLEQMLRPYFKSVELGA